MTYCVNESWGHFTQGCLIGGGPVVGGNWKSTGLLDSANKLLRTFTGFGPEEGLYTVSILASNSRGKAAVPRTGLYSAANDDCCGSVQQPSFQPTGPFRRIISAPAFAVEQGLEYYVDNGVARMRDPFPPGRVTDLAVQTYVNGTLYATLKWSAPGDNFYSDGAADHYELRCHTDRNFSAIFDQVRTML